jgi:hypothetical protein
LSSICEADYVTVSSDAKDKVIPAKEEDLPALIAKLTKK